MKKKYTIRLQGIHDADLINLIKNYDVEARALFKICLLNYVQGNELSYKFSRLSDTTNELTSICVQIEFDDEIEEELKVINLLDNIKPRYKSICMKNVARLYIKMPITSYFIEDNEMADLIEERILESNKECVFFSIKKRKKAKLKKSNKTKQIKRVKPSDKPKENQKAKQFRFLEEEATKEETTSNNDDSLLGMFDGLF